MLFSKRRATIGFIVDRIDEAGGYQSTLWNAIAKTAEEKDINAICFAGGQLKLSFINGKEIAPNPIYELVSNENIDGLIVCSVTIGLTVGLQELLRSYWKSFGLPVVNIGMALEDIPSLVIDNESGVHDAIAHLVEQHNLKRIAFLCGPRGNVDAEGRLKGYKNALKTFGLPYDPLLCVEGDFLRQSGREAVKTLLDDRKVAFDAIVSANDDMAIGVLEELRKQNVHIPDDVAIVGFDDIDDAKTTLPMLSTIRQPLDEIGKKAVEMVAREIKGKPAEKLIVFPTQLILRQTCGCGFETKTLFRNYHTELNHHRPKLERKYLSLLENELKQSKYNRDDKVSEQALLLLEALKETMKNPERIGELVNTVLKTAVHIYSHVEIEPRWHKIMAILSEYAVESAESNEDILRNFQICNVVWEMFGKISWLANSSYRLKNERRTEPIRKISDSLVITFDIRILMNTITSIIEELGVKRCWISVFDQKTPQEMAKVVLGFDASKGKDKIAEGLLFPAKQLIPLKYQVEDRQWKMILIPLKFKGEIFGYSMYDMVDVRDLGVYELLNAQISTAYQGASVVEQLRETQAMLRKQANVDVLTKIYNRRYFLEFALPTFNSAYRYQRNLSLILIDLDNFKEINDRYGHNNGDCILRGVADLLNQNVRSPDILARYGGDEFVVIMPETTHSEAKVCAERLKEMVEEYQFQIDGEEAIYLTISLGVACLQHQTDKSLDDLIYRADQALYQAKVEGRNRVVNFQ